MRKYRIGIFGHTAAGKTSTLLSLSLNRNPLLSNTSCNLVPLSAESRKSSQGKGLERGTQWIRKAHQRLKEDLPVDANDISVDQLVLEYDVAEQGGDSYRVSIFDYSGELVSSDKQTDKLAEHLINNLSQKLDGLMVLIPASINKDEACKVKDQLLELQQTFTLINQKSNKVGTKLDTPIALVVTKWDLIGQTDHFQTESDRALDLLKENEDYLTHLSVYKNVQTVVSSENFYFGPMSAFGKCKRIKSEDGLAYSVPKSLDPLNAYGVVEPVVWLCQRAQQIKYQRVLHRFEQYKQKSSLARAMSEFGRFGVDSPKSISSEMSEVQDQFSEKSKEYGMLIGYKKSIYISRLRNLLVLVSIALGLSLMIETGIDHKHRLEADANITQKDVPWPKLAESNRWLQSYIRTSFPRHTVYKLFFTKDKAQKLANQYGADLAEKIWLKIQTEIDFDIKKQLLTNYIVDFPNGAKLGEANDMLKLIKEKQERQRWSLCYERAESLDNQIACLKNYLDDPSANARLKEEPSQKLQLHLEEREDKVWEPVITVETAEEQRLAIKKYLEEYPQGRYTKLAHELISQLDKTKKCNEFQRAYEDAMSRNVQEAYQRLKSKPECDVDGSLRASFAERAFIILEQESSKKYEQKMFSDAVMKMKGYLQIESAFTSDSKRQDAQLQVERYRQGWDQSLYDEVLMNPSDSACQEYVAASSAGQIPGVMVSYVNERYIYNQNRRSGEFVITPRVLKAGCDIFYKQTFWSVTGINNPSRKLLRDSIYFSASRDDSISITFKLKANYVWSNPTHSDSRSLTIEELLQRPETISLRCHDDDNDYYKVQFSLEEKNKPDAPQLPAWSLR